MPQDPFAAYRRQSAQPAVAPRGDADPFAAYRRTSPPPRRPVSAEDFIDAPSRGWPAKIGDVAVGMLKGVGERVASLGEMAGNIPIDVFNPAAGNLRDAVDTLYAKPGLSRSAFAATNEAMTAQNTSQMVGKGLEQAAEFLVPTVKGAQLAVDAIPSAARAGEKFQNIMKVAKNVPINTDAAGEVGLRIMQLAERGGGSLPRPVSQLLQRITNPDKAPLLYEEARDFASGISRLSANEFQRLTPTVAREVAGLRVALNKSIGEAANTVGKGKDYGDALMEYSRAKKLRGLIDDVVTGAKRTAPYATAAGAGYWLTHQMLGLLGGD